MRLLSRRETARLLVLIALLVACEAGGRASSGASFLTADNLARTLRDFSFVGIAAVGACIVILSGGVDLSAGSVMGLSAVLLASLYVDRGVAAAPALIATIVAGGVVGAVNGILIGAVGLPPFVATLGMLSIARGLSYWITGGLNVPLDWEARGEGFFAFRLLGDASVGALLVLALAATVALAGSRFGRYVYALGGNEVAARLSSLRVPRIKVAVYATAGVLSAIAGCAFALRYGSASVAVGQGYELQIIAACVVGGASLSGGQGTIAGAVIGAAILQLLRELLIQLHVQDRYMEITYGVTIVLAVTIDQLGQRRVFERWLGSKAG